MNNMTPTVKQLLIINIMLFIGVCLMEKQMDALFALHNMQDDDFHIWQLITHMFMHANIAHIAFNMFALVSFGSLLEHFWGSKKLLFFYVSCGLGAAFLQLGINYLEIQHILSSTSHLNLSSVVLDKIMNINMLTGTLYDGDLFKAAVVPILENAGKLNLLHASDLQTLYTAAATSQGSMVGASGAIYGLMVAFAFMFPTAELAMLFIPIPIKAKYFVPGIIAVDLILGLYGSSLFGDNRGGGGIAHFAHIGGALIGFIMMWYWKKNQFNNKRWD